MMDQGDRALEAAPLFSIVVPVYNTARVLARCLKSAAAQSLADIEIIVVDDGSTDGSGDVAQQIARDDRRVRLFRQANAGQGVARNLGLAEARGRYVLFLDSDDFIDPRTCEIVAAAFARTNADVVSFRLRFETELGATVAVRGPDDVMESEQPGIFADAMLDRNFLSSPCNKAVRRDLLTCHTIRFPALRAYEDALFSRHVALHARRVAFIPDVLYHALTRDGSTTRSLSVRHFEIAGEMVALERKLFGADVEASVFDAHIVRFFCHLLILAAFRISDRADRAACRALADAAGFKAAAQSRQAREHLPAKVRLQLLLVRHPGLLRLAARIASRLGIRPY